VRGGGGASSYLATRPGRRCDETALDSDSESDRDSDFVYFVTVNYYSGLSVYRNKLIGLGTVPLLGYNIRVKKLYTRGLEILHDTGLPRLGVPQLLKYPGAL